MAYNHAEVNTKQVIIAIAAFSYYNRKVKTRPPAGSAGGHDNQTARAFVPRPVLEKRYIEWAGKKRYVE